MIVQLAATTSAPAEARAAVCDAIAGDPRLEAASLAASEVVTNALVHGELDEHELIELRIAAIGPLLLVEVLNEPAPGFAVGQIVAGSAGDGLQAGGLRIVAALSADWGAALDEGRTLVWFEIA
jgi:anti-sigma regulatory factor (Ser/Thr protein kinase)